jgi:hypothetical protein
MSTPSVALRFAARKGPTLQHAHDQSLPAGTPVDVFSRFSDAWTPGFEIAAAVQGGYQLRRASDRSVLPGTFLVDDLRRRHRAR